MPERNIYLKTIPAAQAVELAVQALDRERLIRRESVPVHEAAGWVLAAPVFARCSSPTFHAAAMDGFAVKAADTFQAKEGAPVRLEAGVTCFPVNTGQVLPADADAVVMIENVVQIDDSAIEIEAPVFPWRHVRRIGEDIVATELLLPQKRLLTAYDVGALLSAGIFEVEVFERVRLVFIPTGDEVLDYGLHPTPRPGEVIESNSQVFCALARTWGASPRRTPPVPDVPEELLAAVERELSGDAHVVVFGAGSSAGSKDFTREVFERVGRVLCHGIATMPGKPTVLGEARGKLLVGAPGYPVSSVVCFEDVLAPVVAWLSRRPAPERQRITARLSRKTPSKIGMEEIVRLAVGRVGGDFVSLARGAGMITSLTKAQAVLRIPPESEGLAQDARVEVELLAPAETLADVLVHVGSHDNTLDLIANELMGLAHPVQLVSSHVGSEGGLAALKSGSAHFAGSHIFDPATSDFNFPSLARYIPDLPVLVVNLAIRHQGLIVAKGNPKGIRGVADLAREDVLFINRQRGAGTRILLDHHLNVAGIPAGKVRGYEREEATHMAVAVNVLTGAADCGLGIFSAAKALGLDFAPLAHERYDLIIPKAFAADPKIEALLALVRSPGFKAQIEALGGYETPLTGREMAPGLGLG